MIITLHVVTCWQVLCVLEQLLETHPATVSGTRLDSTGCVCVAKQLRCVFAIRSAVCQHAPAAFSMQLCWTAGVVRPTRSHRN